MDNHETLSIDNKKNIVLISISLILIITPFFYITFPPSTDLPQHLAQIYLLNETLQGNTDLYEINWYAPNNLIYLFLGISSALFSPPLSGKIVLMILVLSWGGSIFYLSKKRNRPFSNAILALIFIFNLSLYWGFLNFLIGWPFFVFWIIYSSKPINKKNWFILLGLSLLLYCSHALWFLVACIWLFFYAASQWKNWKLFVYRLSPIIPIGSIAIVWYKFLASARESGGFDTAAYWSPLSHRFSLNYWTDSLLGGLQSKMELFIIIVILIWLILALVTNRKKIKEKIDLILLLAAAFFLFIMLFAPDKYMNTIYFSRRWLPLAMILLLLSTPQPVIPKKWVYGITCFLFLVFSINTTRSWYFYEKIELSGLKESLHALPKNQEVLGLDFIKYSKYIKGRPFLQTFSYAQVFKGGNLNFTFARHASGIIRFKKPRKIQWTPGLEWFAERIKDQDFLYFDYILVGGNETIQSQFASLKYLNPVTLNKKWCLYQIIHKSIDPKYSINPTKNN